MKKCLIICLSILYCIFTAFIIVGCKNSNTSSSYSSKLDSSKNKFNNSNSTTESANTNFNSAIESVDENSNSTITASNESTKKKTENKQSTEKAATEKAATEKAATEKAAAEKAAAEKAAAEKSKIDNLTNPLKSFKSGEYRREKFYKAEKVEDDNRVEYISLDFDGNKCQGGWLAYIDSDELECDEFITYNNKKYYWDGGNSIGEYIVTLTDDRIILKTDYNDEVYELVMTKEGDLVVTSSSTDSADFELNAIFKKVK